MEAHMTNHELNSLYEERMNHLAPYIRTMPNDDMAQEARIGIYQALKKDPDANNAYLKRSARWQISYSSKRGRSVDNGFWKRDQIKMVHYDHLSPDGMFAFIFKNRTHIPLDDLVNDKIGMDRFLSYLTDVERNILNHKLDGWSDKKIESNLKISHRQFKKIRREILSKIKLAFTGN
jgi:hypothetical protein